jgi:hypothetical protein
MKEGDRAHKHLSFMGESNVSFSKRLRVTVEDVGYSKYGVTWGNIILN